MVLEWVYEDGPMLGDHRVYVGSVMVFGRGLVCAESLFSALTSIAAGTAWVAETCLEGSLLAVVSALASFVPGLS